MSSNARLGLATTLRAALSASSSAALALGLVDGIAAGRRVAAAGLVDWSGCVAATILVYGLAWSLAALVLALVLHRALRSRSFEERWRVLLALVLGLGVFLDLYWWTRPWLYYGIPATDPRRVAVALVQLAGGLAIGWGVAHVAVVMSGAARRAWVGGFVLVALVGSVYLWHQSSRAGALGRVNDRNRDMPNVLLFVCDALRADVLGCYGNQRVQTPRIDALARDGVVFERAIVQAPFTGSSFGSYFTGKYPRRHGFVKMTADALMTRNITLASHLKSAAPLQPDDYHCIAFMTGALSHASGLVQGFDSYYEAFAGHDLVQVDDPWSVFRSELVLVILQTKLAQRFGDGAVANEAAKWLRAHGRERFFAMVHLFETHTPYDPPADLRALYCDPNYRGPVSAFRSDHREAIEQGRATPSEADIEQIRNLYFAGVTHNDRMIANVLAELERQGTLENTLVIVTADHGEELGERGLWEHNHMFQTNLRVPFVVSWPKKLPRSVRVGALIESTDLVPSVCELIGIAPPFEERRDAQGRNYGALDGHSWLQLAHGELDKLRDFAFAENGLEMAVQDLEWKLIVPAVPLETQTLTSLAENPIVRPRLFQLASDPDERSDVIATEPAQAERLLTALKAWDASMPIPRTDIVQSARDIEQAQRRLRELGYVDGVGQGVPRKPK